MDRPDNTVLLLVGPTAVGKTEMSLLLAEALHGEIVSADSRQVYRHMDIGTAKPSAGQRSRVPHHLIDIVNPDETYTAGEYSRQGRKAIEAIQGRGRLPIVVGGSGLYIRALVDGFFKEKIDDPQVRKRLREEARMTGIDRLHERLSAIDPKAAQRIHPHDAQRIVRALEVYEITGRPLSDIQQHSEQVRAGFAAVFVGLAMARELLYHRIDRRVDEMMQAGLVDEVKMLSEMGYRRHLNAMQTVGYQEICACLAGEMALEEAVRLIKQHSRQYAKRQLTWFRKDQRIQWIELGDENRPDTVCQPIIDVYRQMVCSSDRQR